jgi:5-enolpyruvylshikimate-3-phosphate synthase
MALPLLEGDSTILYDRTKTSHGYIDITIEVMKSFGVVVERIEEGYKVPGNQRYKTAGIYKIEGDWSSAANWLVAGALTGEICVSGLNAESSQSDRAIIDILQKSGAYVTISKNKIIVKKSSLKAAEYDGNEFLDIIPIVSVACALAEGVSEFSNIERLKYKESNRLESIATMLNCLKIKNNFTADGIKICGGEFIPQVEITLPPDHRLIMALAVAGLTMDSLVINNAEAVTKSYPDFFEDLKGLGGRVICL